MNDVQRQALIERYTMGYQAVHEALGGLSAAELDLDEAGEGWTPRQIVHHLADSEMTSAIRIRRLLAEDHPVIGGYDEATFARVLRYSERPIEGAMEAFAAARRTTAEILAVLTPAEWQREGTHTDSGRYTVEDWLEIYAAHAFDHAAQIRRASGRAGAAH